MLKFPSKSYQEREKKSIAYLTSIQFPKAMANYCRIRYHFVWPSKAAADISNKIESINDMLVKY